MATFRWPWIRPGILASRAESLCAVPLPFYCMISSPLTDTVCSGDSQFPNDSLSKHRRRWSNSGLEGSAPAALEVQVQDVRPPQISPKATVDVLRCQDSGGPGQNPGSFDVRRLPVALHIEDLQNALGGEATRRRALEEDLDALHRDFLDFRQQVGENLRAAAADDLTRQQTLRNDVDTIQTSVEEFRQRADLDRRTIADEASRLNSFRVEMNTCFNDFADFRRTMDADRRIMDEELKRATRDASSRMQPFTSELDALRREMLDLCMRMDGVDDDVSRRGAVMDVHREIHDLRQRLDTEQTAALREAAEMKSFLDEMREMERARDQQLECLTSRQQELDSKLELVDQLEPAMQITCRQVEDLAEAVKRFGQMHFTAVSPDAVCRANQSLASSPLSSQPVRDSVQRAIAVVDLRGSCGSPEMRREFPRAPLEPVAEICDEDASSPGNVAKDVQKLRKDVEDAQRQMKDLVVGVHALESFREKLFRDGVSSSSVCQGSPGTKVDLDAKIAGCREDLTRQQVTISELISAQQTIDTKMQLVEKFLPAVDETRQQVVQLANSITQQKLERDLASEAPASTSGLQQMKEQVLNEWKTHETAIRTSLAHLQVKVETIREEAYVTQRSIETKVNEIMPAVNASGKWVRELAADIERLRVDSEAVKMIRQDVDCRIRELGVDTTGRANAIEDAMLALRNLIDGVRNDVTEQQASMLELSTMRMAADVKVANVENAIPSLEVSFENQRSALLLRVETQLEEHRVKVENAVSTVRNLETSVTGFALSVRDEVRRAVDTAKIPEMKIALEDLKCKTVDQERSEADRRVGPCEERLTKLEAVVNDAEKGKLQDVEAVRSRITQLASDVQERQGLQDKWRSALENRLDSMEVLFAGLDRHMSSVRGQVQEFSCKLSPDGCSNLHDIHKRLIELDGRVVAEASSSQDQYAQLKERLSSLEGSMADAAMDCVATQREEYAQLRERVQILEASWGDWSQQNMVRVQRIKSHVEEIFDVSQKRNTGLETRLGMLEQRAGGSLERRLSSLEHRIARIELPGCNPASGRESVGSPCDTVFPASQNCSGLYPPGASEDKFGKLAATGVPQLSLPSVASTYPPQVPRSFPRWPAGPRVPEETRERLGRCGPAIGEPQQTSPGVTPAPQIAQTQGFSPMRHRLVESPQRPPPATEMNLSTAAAMLPMVVGAAAEAPEAAGQEDWRELLRELRRDASSLWGAGGRGGSRGVR